MALDDREWLGDRGGNVLNRTLMRSAQLERRRRTDDERPDVKVALVAATPFPPNLPTGIDLRAERLALLRFVVTPSGS